MAEIIRMPRLSDTMEEGNIVSWLKKVGDVVKPGDVLAEVETDKATMELESFFSGTLLYISVDKGVVPVDGIIAIIGNSGDDVNKILADAGTSAVPTPKPTEAVKSPSPSIPESIPQPVVASVAAPIPAVSTPIIQSNENGRIKASPLAKSIATEAGLDLNRVIGSGESGRIIKKDVESFIAHPTSAPASISTTQLGSPVLPSSLAIAYGDMPVSQMRKVIAKRLGESKFTAPHFYLTMEINMDNAMTARKAINEDGEHKISFNDMVVKASALALRKHRMVNSSWYGDKIVIHEEINIGVAVAVTDGLLVPVINNADQKGMALINQEVKILAAKAKEKKLQPQEMQGNTFTISNLGMFDVEEFTAIINPPDACILAVGTITAKPIVVNNQIVIGNIMKVTLSCDHRVVDGATGAQFLQTLKSLLENPVKMLT